MRSESEIAESIKALAATPEASITAIVTHVDLNAMECDVDPPGMAPIPGVRLRAAKGVTDGVVQIPKIGGSVVVAPIGGSEEHYYVAQCAEVDKIVMNNGENGGLVKVLPLVDGLEKNNRVLSAILEIIGGAPVNEPGNGLPSALQATLKARLSGLGVGDFSDLENKKITH